jgi:universal stress protein E
MPRAIDCILIAVKDPSVADCAAVRKGAQLARSLRAQLCLYHALTEPLYVESSPDEKALERAKEVIRAPIIAQMERLAAPLRTGGLNVITEASFDYPSHQAVVRAALRLAADLLVVDCPRQSHAGTWFLHFTDWEILRSSPIPVLLIKNPTSYMRAPVLAALDPEHVGGKPAGLDSSIIDYGAALASALDDQLHAVHAFNPLPSMWTAQLVAPQLQAELEQQVCSKAQELLSPVLDRVGVEIRHRHIEEGFAIDVIERVLRHTGAQILVMGSISRGGIAGLMVGNTAERMLDRVACDILIVKPQEFVNTVPHRSRGLHVVPRVTWPAAIRTVS